MRIYSSEKSVDRTHQITLIPGGIAPVLTGMEELENNGNQNITEERKVFVIRDNGV